MELLPVDTNDILINGILSVISANIVPIIAVLAFASGVMFIIKTLNSAVRGNLGSDDGMPRLTNSGRFDRRYKKYWRGE